MFFKCTKSIEGIVALSTSTDVYRKEIYFYEELHKRIRPAVRVPQAFGWYFTTKLMIFSWLSLEK